MTGATTKSKTANVNGHEKIHPFDFKVSKTLIEKLTAQIIAELKEKYIFIERISVVDPFESINKSLKCTADYFGIPVDELIMKFGGRKTNRVYTLPEIRSMAVSLCYENKHSAIVDEMIAVVMNTKRINVLFNRKRHYNLYIGWPAYANDYEKLKQKFFTVE